MYLPENVFIAGLLGSGKDTLASALVTQAGFTRLAFADPLKEAMAARLNISLEELERRKGELRPLLQEFGAEQRAADEDYWIKEWFRRRMSIDGPVVCPDVRYHNEAFFALSSGGLLLRVVVPETKRIARLIARDGRFDPNWGNHQSEQYVNDLPVHAEIPGDLPEEYRLTTIEAIYAALMRLTV